MAVNFAITEDSARTASVPLPQRVNGTPPVTSERPEPPAPELVHAKVQELLALERDLGTREFSEALADNIMEPLPVETAAFRSDELAYLSWVATKTLMEHSGLVIKQRRRGSREEIDTRHFLVEVTREQRILKAILDGLRAKNGQLANQPNPRRRAERRLVQENLKGDVPKGRFVEILKDEEEKIAQAKRDAKRRRADARKQERQQRPR